MIIYKKEIALKYRSVALPAIFAVLLVLSLSLKIDALNSDVKLLAQELSPASIDTTKDIEYLKSLQAEYEQKIASETKTHQLTKASLMQNIQDLQLLVIRTTFIRKKIQRLTFLNKAKQELRILNQNYSLKMANYRNIIDKIKKRIAVVEAFTYPAGRLEIGAFMFDAYNTIPHVQNLTGNSFDLFLHYQSISENFDVKLADYLWARGTKIQLAFEPHKFGVDINSQPQYKLTTITNGNHDSSLTRWAKEIKAFGHPVYFRPMCEMNGDWVVWGGTVNGNKPADYIPAWRRIHKIFKDVGADNAIFVWAPNVDVSRKNALATYTQYYPGDDYVDIIGLNGYNWGTTQKTPTWTSWWRTFSEVIDPSYAVFAENTNKPMMISEMASADPGGSKATWIKDMFFQIRNNYPRIKAITWFNVNKETDWRFYNTSTSLEAFKSNAWPATP